MIINITLTVIVGMVYFCGFTWIRSVWDAIADLQDANALLSDALPHPIPESYADLRGRIRHTASSMPERDRFGFSLYCIIPAVVARICGFDNWVFWMFILALGGMMLSKPKRLRIFILCYDGSDKIKECMNDILHQKEMGEDEIARALTVLDCRATDIYKKNSESEAIMLLLSVLSCIPVILVAVLRLIW